MTKRAAVQHAGGRQHTAPSSPVGTSAIPGGGSAPAPATAADAPPPPAAAAATALRAAALPGWPRCKKAQAVPRAQLAAAQWRHGTAARPSAARLRRAAGASDGSASSPEASEASETEAARRLRRLRCRCSAAPPLPPSRSPSLPLHCARSCSQAATGVPPGAPPPAPSRADAAAARASRRSSPLAVGDSSPSSRPLDDDGDASPPRAGDAIRRKG